MNYLPFALLAYFFNGIAVLIDKFLLTAKIKDPLIYIFYISLFSFAILALLPLTHIPNLFVFIVASVSTVVWTSGLYFMYKALRVGLVSRVIPIIGVLIPIFLMVEAIFTKNINNSELIAIIVLVLGLVFLTMFEWRGHIKRHELAFEFTSAFLFAVSYVILRQAFLMDNFITVLVWSRIILMPVAFIILLIPATRKIVLAKDEGPNFSLKSKMGVLFMFGQAAGGSSELLITFSVSLATPALVNSLQGSQYLFLFIASLFLGKKFPEIFKEQHTHLKTAFKILGIICIAVGLYILAFYK
jgi:drug/metabolite transporter (DMT)-like permease